MLINAKMRPSRTPTKIVGSAAGNMIFQNCWVGVRLKLRPTLTRTLRVLAMPSIVFRMTGGSAGFAGLLKKFDAVHQHTAGDAEHREHNAGRQAFAQRQQKPGEYMFLD